MPHAKGLITLRLIGVRKTRRGGKKGAKKEEGVKEGGGSGGDYTIIQITAGYNLVADVSRSTMPTTHTHRRACVRTYAPTESESGKRPLMKQKTTS